MSGIEIGIHVYRIVSLSPERSRFEIHSTLTDTIIVYPRHSILSLTYNEVGGQIELLLVNGSAVVIPIPIKSLGGERDTRCIPKLKKLFSELADMIS